MGAALKLTPQDYESQSREIQQKYQKLMMEAAANGQVDQMTELANKMTAEIQELAERYQTSLREGLSVVSAAPAPQRYSYKSEYTSLNLDEIVCEAERTYFEGLHADPVIGELARRFTQQESPGLQNTALAGMAKHAIKLDLRLAPQLKQVVERCMQILKLNVTPIIHIVASPTVNAFAMGSPAGQINIGLSSAVLDQMTPAEQATIIGHELGHVLLGHVNFPTGAILRSEAPELTPVHAMKLFAWQRACELSADRFSLLCGESFEKSARGLFKVCYGFSVNEDAALHDYLGQLAQGAAGLKELCDLEDFYSTHPLPPLRLSALGLFAKSERFARAVGKPAGAALGIEDLEKQTQELLGLCESSFLQNPAALSEEVQKFYFYASVLVGMCDGLVEAELQALANTLKREIKADEINAILEQGAPQIAGITRGLTPVIRDNLSESQRLTLLRDLCMIALADGRLTSDEIGLLQAIASDVGIKPQFINHVLAEYVQT